jgi:hypothetical protein
MEYSFAHKTIHILGKYSTDNSRVLFTRVTKEEKWIKCAKKYFHKTAKVLLTYTIRWEVFAKTK